MAIKIEFKKGVKRDAKARVALMGPGGSGKTMTGLRLLRHLVGPTGRIAAIDTEHGSMEKYAPLPGHVADNVETFDFDVIKLSEFSHEHWLAAHEAAVAGGFDAFFTDSLSHFWMGPGGALEFVDNANARQKDKMSGWKDFRPHERKMVDTMIASPMHIACTMRTKTDYETIVVDGQKRRVKVGLAPVQRDGLEYEFDLVFYMDDDNKMIVDKTRCSYYARKVIAQPKASDFEPFRIWLGAGKGIPADQSPLVHEGPKATTAPSPNGAHSSVNSSGDTGEKGSVPQDQSPARPSLADTELSLVLEPFLRAKTSDERRNTAVQMFGGLQKSLIGMLGEEDGLGVYSDVLGSMGVQSYQQFQRLGDIKKCVALLLERISVARAQSEENIDLSADQESTPESLASGVGGSEDKAAA